MTPVAGATSRRVPPGPSLPALRGCLAQLRDDPLNLYLGAQRQYGDVVRLRAFGPVYLYLVSHPDDVEHVLRANVQNYPKGFISDVLRSGIGNGLLTSEGDLWLRQRRLMQPAFHRQRLAKLVDTMADAAQKLVERWQPLTQQKQPFDVAAEMNRLTLEIVSRTLFGVDVSGEASAVRQALAITNGHASYRYLHPFAPPPWIPTTRNRRAARAGKTLDQLVHQIIATRRRQSTHDQHDLLAMLLEARDDETGEGMSNQQLRDEVLTILLAGHETTANALAWTWYLLATHPEVERTLRAELAAVLKGRPPGFDDLPNLPYTRMVIDESLRLYPPAWGTARQARAADQIRGYYVPAKAPVVISQYVTHRHPDFWDDPETFDPLRFSPARAFGRHKFAYFPFSGGPRQCIGNHFALLESQVIIATIVQRYRLALVADHPIVPEAGLNLRPRFGVQAMLYPQEAEHE